VTGVDVDDHDQECRRFECTKRVNPWNLKISYLFTISYNGGGGGNRTIQPIDST